MTGRHLASWYRKDTPVALVHYCLVGSPVRTTAADVGCRGIITQPRTRSSHLLAEGDNKLN